MEKMYNEDDSDFDEDFDESSELYGTRDGTLFLIDSTPKMFEKDPIDGIPYFVQCIKQYAEILKQKLVWNRQDWTGLMLMGTEESDEDSSVKNILTLQELSLVSLDKLKQAMKIESATWKTYKNSSTQNFPLHDAFWLATRAFQPIRATMSKKHVIFFTATPNPKIDANEKHRIRVKAASFSDLKLKLFVIGFGDDWSHEPFYQDLEMQSRKIDMDDYSPISMKDLLQQVKVPARNMAKFAWRIGDGVEVDVTVRNLCVKTQYLKMADISRETNEPLYTCTEFVLPGEENGPPILEMDMEKFQNFGGKKIRFTLPEVRNLNASRVPGIDLICFEPISFLHLLFHYETPFFVTAKKNSSRKDNALLFAALLKKCENRKLMIICAATIRKRSSTALFAMIPHSRYGGFYFYRIPFKGNVRRLKQFFPNFVFDDEENKPPVEENGVELMRKLIEKLNIDFHPKMFCNPKLRVQLRTVETLALDLEEFEEIEDETLPKIDEMREKTADLLEEYDEIFSCDFENFEMPPKKKTKKENVNFEELLNESEGIKKIVEKKLLEKLTLAQLKTALKTLELKASGRKKKAELIEIIEEFFQ